VNRIRFFRLVWWTCNLLFAVSLVVSIWCGVWEYSVRKYLRGFSDAIVADSASTQQKAEAILDWMRVGPPRMNAPRVEELSARDPQDTLNYQQLLQVCGTATNAFLNLARSTGIPVRRLLLLAPDHKAKHVVAEVNVGGRWVIVDATYRTFMRDAKGDLLTREDLRKPEIFREAAARIPGYVPEYSYESSAHVRFSALPFNGFRLRQYLDRSFPEWDSSTSWSLLLERRSFLYLFLSGLAVVVLSVTRVALGWLADNRLQVPRFHLRNNIIRATAAFFTTPEIK
jgi:Transglutaminase-like superfamily